MGATLPVLATVLVRTRTFRSTSITRLYTCNLGGAICGTIIAGFLLLPRLGLLKTILVTALTNIVIGLIAGALDRGKVSDEVVSESVSNDFEAKAAEASSEATTFWLSAAFVSGFVTISTQVAWTRVLTMVIGSSTYAFSIVVALFLIGLSLGAVEIGRKVRTKDLRRTLVKVQLGTGVSLLLSLWVTNQIPWLLVFFGLKSDVDSWRGLLTLQIICASLLILFPAFLMGTVMPLVLVWAGRKGSEASVKFVGRSYAINTVGAIVGAFLAGFILIVCHFVTTQAPRHRDYFSSPLEHAGAASGPRSRAWRRGSSLRRSCG